MSKYGRTATPGVIKQPTAGGTMSTKHDRIAFYGRLRPGPADYDKMHLTDIYGRFNNKYSRLGKSAHSGQFGRQERTSAFSHTV